MTFRHFNVNVFGSQRRGTSGALVETRAARGRRDVMKAVDIKAPLWSFVVEKKQL